MNQINVAQIVSVKSFINYISTRYIYKKAKRICLFWKQKEGYYYTYTIGSPYFESVESIESSGCFVCKKEEVYYKPHIEIRMSDGSCRTKYFETKEELEVFMQTDEMKNITWIKL